jgi:DNA polymerase-3 subunit delta'
MQFNDVIGQQMAKQHLVEMLQHNRLSHALLFLGKEGSGSLPLALAFTQYITCDRVQNRGTGTSTASLFGLEEAPAPINADQPLPSDS